MPESLENAPYRISTSCFKKVRGQGSGQLNWNHDGVTAVLNWIVELSPPSGLFNLTFGRGDPYTINQTIRLTCHMNNKGYPIWKFLCPKMTSSKCQIRSTFIYMGNLGEDPMMSCHQCAGYDYDSRRIRDKTVDALVRNPAEIRRLLGSRYTPPRQKLRALEAVGILERRRARLLRKLAKLQAAVKAMRGVQPLK